MAGYKLISNTFILSGSLAASALLYSNYVNPLVTTTPASPVPGVDAEQAVDLATAATTAAVDGANPILGAIAILSASLLPFVLQQTFVPRYVSSLALNIASPPSTQSRSGSASGGGGGSGGGNTGRTTNMAAIAALSSLSPQTPLLMTYFSPIGTQRTVSVTLADLTWTPVRKFTWANLRNARDGKVYSFERRNLSPAAARVVGLIRSTDDAVDR